MHQERAKHGKPFDTEVFPMPANACRHWLTFAAPLIHAKLSSNNDDVTLAGRRGEGENEYIEQTADSSQQIG